MLKTFKCDVLAQKALQASDTEMRVLLEGTKYIKVLPVDGLYRFAPKGKSLIFVRKSQQNEIESVARP